MERALNKPSAVMEADGAAATALGIEAGGSRTTAHDIRNRLQVIASAIRMMSVARGAADGGEIERLAACAIAAVDRIAALNRKILDPSTRLAGLDPPSTSARCCGTSGMHFFSPLARRCMWM